MFLNQLSGYPLIDINISYIFHYLSPEIILEAFIFSFLEYNIVFYCPNQKLLNIILYLFKCFNYPFNDSIRYQCILSISKDLFMSEISTFIDNTYSTMVGVLSKYDPEIFSNKIIKEHFVLDIENKKFFLFYKEENDKVKDTICLYTYIKSCIEDSNFFNIFKSKDNFQDGIKLYESIQNILEKLKSRSYKLTSIDYSLSRNASFFNKYGFETEMQSIEWNKRLQEAFYVFILQIIKNFGIKNYSHIKNDFVTDKSNCEIINNYLEIINDFENVSNSRMPSFVKEYDIPAKENQKLSNKNLDAKKAGEIFKEQLLKSSKYYSFASRNYNPIDLYKIPYTFINEFIYYSQFKHLNEINIFNLIDQFYGKIKLLDIEELSKEKEEKEEKYMELKLNLRKEEKK